jgi:hypothetical protein
MPRRSHIITLGTYLLKNSRFKSFIYDRWEIRCIADNLGFTPDRVRTGMRKLGYCLIRNAWSNALEEECCELYIA